MATMLDGLSVNRSDEPTILNHEAYRSMPFAEAQRQLAEICHERRDEELVDALGFDTVNQVRDFRWREFGIKKNSASQVVALFDPQEREAARAADRTKAAKREATLDSVETLVWKQKERLDAIERELDDWKSAQTIDGRGRGLLFWLPKRVMAAEALLQRLEMVRDMIIASDSETMAFEVELRLREVAPPAADTPRDET